MSLSLRDRVMLARQAYLRAVAFARAQSTPASWTRLLTAARNRAEALREQEFLEAEAGTNGRAARRPLGREARGAPSSPPPAVRTRPRPVRSTGLALECERARALMAWSRALVRESRALQHALVSLAALRSRPLPPRAAADPAQF